MINPVFLNGVSPINSMIDRITAAIRGMKKEKLLKNRSITIFVYRQNASKYECGICGGCEGRTWKKCRRKICVFTVRLYESMVYYSGAGIKYGIRKAK